MAVIRLVRNANYSKNYNGFTPGDSEGPCVICGRAVKAPAKYWVHEVNGGGEACTPDEDEQHYQHDGGDLGAQPIGANCVKLHPELKPYIRRR